MKNLAIIKIITNDTSDSLLRSLLYLVLFILSTPVCSQDLVGTIDGAFSVSPTGAATYTIPIDLRAGYGGAAPQLSLTYSSNGGNGPVGLGWSIGGLSAITAVPHSLHYDSDASGITLTSADAYALDGQRLLLKSGSNGTVGACYVMEEDNYTRIYIDSVFASTPKTFTVKSPDGSTRRYGSATAKSLLRHPSASGTSAFGWLLDYLEDKDGNTVRYSYTYYNSVPYLTKIQYGSNTHACQGSCNVTLEYAVRPDTVTSHVLGATYKTTRRLSRVLCRYYGNTLYRKYVLTYDNSAYHSRLLSVKETGSGTTGYPATTFTWTPPIPALMSASDVDVFSLAGTTFSNSFYFPGDVDNDGRADLIGVHPNDDGWSAVSVSRLSGSTFNISETYTASSDYGAFFSDKDFSHLSGGIVAHLGKNHRNNIVLPILKETDSQKYVRFECVDKGWGWNNPLSHSSELPPYAIADLDHDGIDAIIYAERAPLSERKIHLTTLDFTAESGYHAASSTRDITISSMTNTQKGGEVTGLLASDFDGDGLADLLVQTTHCAVVLWNTNGTIDGQSYTIVPALKKSDTLQPADFNGDGLVDLLVNESSSTTWKKAVNKGVRSSSMFTVTIVSELATRNARKQEDKDSLYFCYATDLDSDGLSDIVTGFAHNDLLHTCWLRSKRNGTFEIACEKVSPSTSLNTLAWHNTCADFDGDGQNEIVCYGTNLCTGGTGTVKSWRLHRNNSFTPSVNRITSVTDGVGKTTSVGYSSLLDGYNCTGTASYPLMKFHAPLPVVTSSCESHGGTAYSTAYTYSDGRAHLTGKGFLGFLRTTVECSGVETTTLSAVDTERYTPYMQSVTSRDLAGHTICHRSYTYSFVPGEAEKSYHRLLTSEYVNDIPSRKKESVAYSDFHYGKPQKAEASGSANTTTQTVYRDYTSGGLWQLCLPLTVTSVSTSQLESGEEDSFTTKTAYTYDTWRRVSSKRTYSGKTTAYLTSTELYDYDSGGNLTRTRATRYSSTDTLTTQCAYDTLGRVTSTTAADGRVTTHTYNNAGLLLTELDSWTSIRNAYSYDVMGRLARQVRRHTGNLFAPDTLYQDISQTDNTAHAYKVTKRSRFSPTTIEYYDGFARQVATGTIHYNGQEYVSETRYATPTLISGVTVAHAPNAPPADSTSYTYDTLQRPIRVRYPGGKTVETAYSGNVTTVTENAVATDYVYDEYGRLETRTDSHGDINYYYKASGEYDRIDLCYMEGDDHTATYTYDRYGRLSTITDPNGNQRKYTYNTNGYLLSYAFDNNREYYTHNKYGDLTAKSYYPEGLLEHANYTYDSHRQLVAVNGPGFSESVTYNAAGQAKTRTRSVTVNGATHTRTATYTYDGENRLSSISNALDSVGTPLVETDTYRLGWLVDRSLNGTSVWQLHGEDGQGRPGWVSDQLAQRQLVYDTAGNLLAHRFAFNVPGNHALLAHTYTYDTCNRLTSMDGKAYGYDGYNQLVSWNGNGYSFDAKGNIEVEGAQTSVTYNNYRLSSVGSPEPEVWGRNTLSVHYNGWNKPFYMNQTGNDVNHSGESFFYYDCEGNRTGMVVYKYTNDTFPYDPELLYQRTYVDPRYEVNTDWRGVTTRYYYIGGDALEAQAVAVIDGSGMRVKQIYRDIQGSILELADSTAVEHYHYTPWGQYCDEDGNTDAACYHRYGDAGHPFHRGFLGQEHLLYFGLVNLNARLYDPFIGRFLTPDPVYDAERAITGFNPYAYGYNNPAVYSDPSGEIVTELLIGGALIGGICNVAFNMSDINSAGDFFLYFGVGAAAGAATTLTGGLSFGLAGFAGGFVSGAISGAIGGAITGLGNALISGMDVANSVLKNALYGAIGGGLFNGISQGLSSLKHGSNFWTGKSQQNDLIELNDYENLYKQKPNHPSLRNSYESTTGSSVYASEKYGTYGDVNSFSSKSFIRNDISLEQGNYSVYAGFDKEGYVRYVGISKRNLEIRFSEHLRSGTERADLQYIGINNMNHLSRNQARHLEQLLINRYGMQKNRGMLYNKINSIAPNKWNKFGITINF